MHELSLAQNVVEILCEEATRHGLSQVTGYKLRVGQLRGVVPDLLRTCLDLAGRGTVAEQAEVELEVIAGHAHCGCGEEFSVSELLFLCPRCGRPGAEITSGQELRLVEIEGD